MKPGFVQRSIREQLKEQFPPEASFYVLEGRPCMVFADWDHAEDWARHQTNMIHPSRPVISGTEITEAQFRTLVRAMHSIGGP